MMIDLCQWRISIGAWNCCKQFNTTSTSGRLYNTLHYKYNLPFYEGTSLKGKIECPKLLVTFICFGIYLLILSGDVETNPGPTDHPSEIFKKIFGFLSNPLGKEPNFTAVTDFLFGENLITKPQLDSIKSRSLDNHQRGSELAYLLYDKLINCDETESRRRLLLICDIFERDEVGDERLKKLGIEIRETLDESISERSLLGKPTRQELTEILRCSKFTGCTTWEHVVCCLPNMSQEIIDTIKQREPVVEIAMTNVTQHWLNNNPDDSTTWRHIVIALLNVDEAPLAYDILQTIVEPKKSDNIGNVSKVHKTLSNVLTSHFLSLSEATEYCIGKVAEEMFTRKLVNKRTKISPSYIKCHDEFQTHLQSQKSLPLLERKCQMFLYSLASVGGRVKEAADSLACDWKMKVMEKHDFQLSIQPFDKAYDIIDMSEKDIESALQNLPKEFADILSKIKLYYEKHNSVAEIGGWVSDYYGEQGFAGLPTIYHLFEKIQPRFSFLNCEAIEYLVEKYQVSDELKAELDAYLQKLSRFLKSSQINDIKIAAKTVSLLNKETPEAPCKFVIKLSTSWRKQTVENFYKLLGYLFHKKESIFNLIDVQEGSITLILNVPPSQVPSLLLMAQSKAQYMRLLGIFYLSISNHPPIIDEQEDMNYTLKESLLYTIKNIESDREYERIALLLIEFRKDFDYQNEQKRTALMLAIRYEYWQIVGHLLTKELNVNVQDEHGSTALMYASYFGHHKIVDVLLTKEPDIDIRNNDGMSSLILASNMGHHHVVSLLLTKNPNMNFQFNDKGSTALMFACHKGHNKVVEILLTKEPDINIQDNHGMTALIHAIGRSHYQIIELLLTKELDINFQDKNGFSALMYASTIGNHQIVSLLLARELDLDINLKSRDDGWTALMYASASGHQKVVEVLLTKEPNVNTQNNDGFTALMLASAEGHHQVVSLLLTKKPKINIHDDTGFTALVLASANGHHQVVSVLLANEDVDIMMHDSNGMTALTFASGNGHSKVVEVLLTKEQDINIQDNNGGTSLMVACDNGQYQVVSLLLTKNIDVDIQDISGWTALMYACTTGNHQIVELLLTKELDINIQENNGKTALMVASYKGHFQVVSLLLTKKPNIDIQDKLGWTALMYAIINGHYEIVSLLLTKKPDIDIRNSNGLTALMCAVGLTSTNKQMKTIEVLLDCNNVHPYWEDLVENKQFHILSYAALSNNIKGLKTILKYGVSPQDITYASIFAIFTGNSSVLICLANYLPSLSPNERQLLVASAEGDLGTVVCKLYEDGMSPDIPLVGGITPLMIAASCGHIDILDTLIQAGANVNCTITLLDGVVTVLDTVRCMNKRHDHTDIIALLLENGATSKPVTTSDTLVDDTVHTTQQQSGTSKTKNESRNIFKALIMFKNKLDLPSIEQAMFHPTQLFAGNRKIKKALQNTSQSTTFNFPIV